jgi:hypothetical protein
VWVCVLTFQLRNQGTYETKTSPIGTYLGKPEGVQLGPIQYALFGQNEDRFLNPGKAPVHAASKKIIRN